MAKIILASQSPRRRDLLVQIGLEFLVWPSSVEEKTRSTVPQEVVKELSRQKAVDVAEIAERRYPEEDYVVIGADTIVAYKGEILGKPKDPADAARMLRLLQGNVHSVFTGVTLVFSGKGAEEPVTFSEETRVSMYPISEEEIRWYIASKEPLDKAGAYGIQGYGARFVQSIQGDYGNVVGLPVGRVYQELRKQGRILL